MAHIKFTKTDVIGRKTQHKYSFPLEAFILGWLLMLTLGALHSEVSPEIPALGYWLCTAFTLILQFVASVFKKD